MNYEAGVTGGVKLEDGQIDQLADELSRELDASDTGKGTLPDRWDMNEAIFNLDPEASNLNLVEGMASYVAPLWQPKAKRIIGNTYRALTTIQPYVQVLTDDADAKREEDTEKDLQKLATQDESKTSLNRPLKLALKTACNCGIAAIYGYEKVENGQVVGFCFKPVHPKHLHAYPHEAGSLDECKTVGHSLWILRSEIDARFKAGEFLTDQVSVGTNPVATEAGKSADFAKVSETAAVKPADDLIEVAQLISMRDLGDGLKDHIFLVARQSRKLLKVSPYDRENRPYFEVRFEDEYVSLWPASSPGQDVQAAQLIYSDSINVLIQGSYGSAFPIKYCVGGSFGGAKVRRDIGPNAWLDLPAGVEVGFIDTKFNPGFFPALLQETKEMADGATGISRLGAGQNMPTSTTATAARGFLEGQAEAKEDYSVNVSPVLSDIWRWMLEGYRIHFASIKAHMGDGLRLTDATVLDKPVRFEPTGGSATTDPFVLLQKLQMLLQMSQHPNSQLEYGAIEMLILQTLKLPFDAETFRKKNMGEQLLRLVVEMMAQGAAPELILQAAQEAVVQAVTIEQTNQAGAGGANPAGQPGAGAPPQAPVQPVQGPPGQF